MRNVSNLRHKITGWLSKIKEPSNCEKCGRELIACEVCEGRGGRRVPFGVEPCKACNRAGYFCPEHQTGWLL